MISRQRLNTSTLALVVLGATVLNGCAGTKVWSPELEAATKTYEDIAQDPLVAALASDELAVAQRQLQTAQTAYDEYKPARVVVQEARLAELKALTAQQRARALSANHALQTAMGQQPLLDEQTIAAASPPPPPVFETTFEPIMAAATPYMHTDDIASQLAAMSQQIASLQMQLEAAQSAGGTMQADQSAAFAPLGQVSADQVTADPAGLEQEMTQQLASQSDALQSAEPTAEPAADQEIRLAALEQVTEQVTLQNTDQSIVQTTEQIISEPVIAAAIPAQPEARPLPSAKQLNRELLAMNARTSDRGMALTLGDRYFEGRSARLWTKRANRHLDNVAGFLQRYPSLNLDIEAHTDDEASSEENHDLSMDRATAIKSQLVLRGVEESRINANGFGESRPIAGNDNPLGRLQNRRVELIFPNIPAANI
jgi:outer membrane protein OmpA-like peptidoglycan-associated protein